MSRSAPPGRSSPISQSSLSTLEAKMSDIDSFSAPDWHLYSRSAVRSVIACVSSWAVTSKLAAYPSPNFISCPSQYAL